MTVISAMKFNESEGAMVADEQSSTDIRKYDIATKLHSYVTGNNTLTVIGGSGVADILYELNRDFITTTTKRNEELVTGNMVADEFAAVMNQVKRRYIEGYLQSTLGISESEAQAGARRQPDGSMTPLSQQITQEYYRMLSGESETGKMLRNGTILITKDSKDLQIYRVHMGLANPTPVARPYDTLGSGYESADTELYSFFENMSRDSRENINPVRGTMELLYATHRAGERNIGVGGTPLISIISGGKIITPSASNSRLASEITRAEKRGLLRTEFAYDAIDALAFKGEKFSDIEGAMWDAATDKKQLDLFLRGYKQ